MFRDGDIAALLERYHEDAEWIGPDSDIVPFAGRYDGKMGIAHFFKRLDDAVHPSRFDIRECLAEGDKVVVLGEATWVVRTTGRDYDTPWAHLLTLRDGKVARFESIYDIKSAETAFAQGPGLQPEQGSPLHH